MTISEHTWLVREPVIDAWDVEQSDFPTAGSRRQQFSFLLRYAILAPSLYNAQPWLFTVEDDRVDLAVDRTRRFPVSDPSDRELIVSCGAALLNLRLALRRFGFRDTVEVLPEKGDEDLVARVRVHEGREPSEEDVLLFDAIPKRHTNRRRFASRAVPATVFAALDGEADEEGAWLHLMQGDEVEAVVRLIKGAETILWVDKRYRREVASWTRPHPRRQYDGIPGYAPGLADLDSFLAPFEGKPASGDCLAAGQPALAVLGTPDDGPFAWLSAGQALQRVLLRATADGISVSFLNQPIEVPELRPKLRDLIGERGYPQVVLRLGYGADVKPTPRRPVEEVIV